MPKKKDINEHKYMKYKQKYLNLKYEMDKSRFGQSGGTSQQLKINEIRIVKASENSYLMSDTFSSAGYIINLNEQLTWKEVVRKILKKNGIRGKIKIPEIIVNYNNKMYRVIDLNKLVKLTKINSITIKVE